MSIVRRFGVGVLAFAFVASLTPALPAPAAGILYHLQLPGNESATVFADGVVQIFSKDRRTVELRHLQPVPRYDEEPARSAVPDESEVLAQLAMPHHVQPYAPQRVIVVYRSAYHPALNRVLSAIGVDRSEPLFSGLNRAMLASMRIEAASGGRPVLDFTNAYRLHLTRASVDQAVIALAKQPDVAYASPDWYVSPMHAQALPIQPSAVEAAVRASRMQAWRVRPAASSSPLPTNYALSSSAQSLLNASSMNVAAAYSEIEARFGQLPGEGETITDVSIGDLDDASAQSASSDACHDYVVDYGPTTIVQSGRRYLDLPSMPLIPTYTADSTGKLSESGEVCGTGDPYLEEIGLDFSMMAPLPHDLQRSGEQGTGYTDLLGVAPGASYRLVVPADPAGTLSGIDAALLGAASQTPAPNVITASLGLGYDSQGFPSRYLEEDPLSQAIVAGIVREGIVVCITSNDGTRLYTNAAIGPSGGSTPTKLVKAGELPTSLNDVHYSTVPGQVYDSGAIAAGGTTLDDIFADPPQYATTPQAVAQHAYAETRWTGFTTFSSGFGTRVNVSAPADNVIALTHTSGGAADAVTPAISGGTSASAPLTAAAAAIALQVSRLTEHPLTTPLAVRTLLEQTGSAVPPVTQADRTLHVGPQINVGAMVENLLAQSATQHPTPGVVRVGVEQRRDDGDYDSYFIGDTDSTNIDIQSGFNQMAWITIAPDWAYMPKGVKYRLFVKGHTRKVLAPTPWARLLPVTILQAAGLSLVSQSSRTVPLIYQARVGSKVVASATVPLTFGPAVATVPTVLAPKVPAVVTGSTIPVTYDLSGAASVSNPEVVVSEPGRLNPATGLLYHPAYTAALSASQTKGTVNVPVSALHGAGIYSVAIELVSNTNVYDATFSNFAMTRIAAAAVGKHTAEEGAAGRPNAPLLSVNGSLLTHDLVIPYGSSFQVEYDVRAIKGSTSAMLEISAAGPAGGLNNYNPFNNPNGNVKDSDGVDTGSVYYAALPGQSGTVTIKSVGTGGAGLFPAMNHVVRVIPIASGQPIGEGSDVSTITMDGVAAQDGGYVNNGWGINTAGSDGFITSEQTTASGLTASSLETFSQTTNQIVQNLAEGSSVGYFTKGWGIFGGDVGLFGAQNHSSGMSAYNLLDAATSSIGAAWTPPFPINSGSYVIEDTAANTVNSTGAFLAYDYTGGTNDHQRLFTSNIAANTFSSSYDVAGPIESFKLPEYSAIGENPVTNTAYLAGIDASLGCNTSPTIVTVNLTNGAAGSFAGLGTGQGYGVAVDPTTNKGAILTLCDDGLSIYSLTNNSGTEYTLPGTDLGADEGVYIANDPQAGLFLVAQPTSVNSQTDNNWLSRVLVYNESGSLQETLERFYLYDTELFIGVGNLQVNPTTRTGYLLGPYQQQLAPFSY